MTGSQFWVPVPKLEDQFLGQLYPQWTQKNYHLEPWRKI